MNRTHWKSDALRTTFSTLALAGAISIALISTGCTSDAAEPAGAIAPAQVSVADVVVRDVRPWDEYTGRIAAVDSVELRPRTGAGRSRTAGRPAAPAGLRRTRPARRTR